MRVDMDEIAETKLEENCRILTLAEEFEVLYDELYEKFPNHKSDEIVSLAIAIMKVQK